MDLLIGNSKAAFAAVILEAKPGNCISHTKLSGTRSGVVVLDYPASTQKFEFKSVGPSEVRKR